MFASVDFVAAIEFELVDIRRCLAPGAFKRIDATSDDASARSKGQCGFLGYQTVFIQIDDVPVKSGHSESLAGLHHFVKSFAFGFSVHNGVFDPQIGAQYFEGGCPPAADFR